MKTIIVKKNITIRGVMDVVLSYDERDKYYFMDTGGLVPVVHRACEMSVNQLDMAVNNSKWIFFALEDKDDNVDFYAFGKR